MNNADIHAYYQKAMKVVNRFINSQDNEFQAYENLSKLNKEYQSVIEEDKLVTSIPRTNYELANYEEYIQDPDNKEFKEYASYMKHNWIPSSFC